MCNLKLEDDKEHIELTKTDELFLRLYAHNFSNEEIADFLEIDIKKTHQIKHNIKNSFNVQNGLDLVVKAFNGGYLKKIDYVYDIKEHALKEASNIVYDFFNLKRSNILLSRLEQRVLGFYYSLELRSRESYNMKNKEDMLSNLELEFLRQRIYCFSNGIIKDNGLDKNMFCIQKSIYKKLEVNCWFNVIRICFQLGLVEKPSIHYEGLSKEIVIFVEKVFKIKENSEEQSLKVKELGVYTALLEFYSEASFNSVLANQLSD